MVATVILFLLVVVMGFYLIYYLYDIYQHRDCLEKHTSCVKTGAFGFICLFFDVLGLEHLLHHTTLYSSFSSS